jgi:hypothetical protein
MTDDTCAYEGCTKQRAAHRRWCNTHYWRQYRYGDMATDRTKVAAEGWVSPNGYIKTRRTDHVIAGRKGLVYTHRLVLFDTIGYGPHHCHWCAAPINWAAGLEADHMDFDRANNKSDNIVACCRTCNRRRANARRTTPGG